MKVRSLLLYIVCCLLLSCVHKKKKTIILSKASTLTEVIQEILLTITSERYGRLIDKEQGSSMEVKKQQGYF